MTEYKGATEEEFKALCSMYNEEDETKVKWCEECGRPDNYQCYECEFDSYNWSDQRKILVHPEKQLIYCTQCFDKYEKEFGLPHRGEWLEAYDADSAAICWKGLSDDKFNSKTGEDDEIILNCHDEPSWYLDKQIEEITNIQIFLKNKEEKGEDNSLKHHLKNMKDNVANMLVTGCMYNHGERKKFEYIFDRRIYLKKIGGEMRIFNPHDYEKRHVKIH